MPIVPVILDTDALRADPSFRRAPSRVLMTLAKEQRVQIFVSTISVEELVGGVVDAHLEDLESIRRGANQLRRKALPEDLTTRFQSLVDDYEGICARVEERVRGDVAAWVEESRAQIIEIASEDLRSILDDYFTGSGAFRGRRSREDFPDAFILSSIRSLAEKQAGLKVVTRDKVLSKACREYVDVVFPGVEELIESADLRELIAEHHSGRNANAVLDWLGANPEPVVIAVRGQVDTELSGTWITSTAIRGDNNEGIILGTGYVRSVDVDHPAAVFYGRGAFSVPVHVVVDDCTISFAIFKADYWCLPDDEIEWTSVTDLNDHYYDAEREFSVELSGAVSLQIPEGALETADFDSSQIPTLIGKAELAFEIDEVSVYGWSEDTGWR